MIFFFFLICSFSFANENIYWELNNEKTFSTRLFHKDNAYANQKNTFSVELKSELFVEINKNVNVLLEPYYRYDQHDKERSLFDIAQGYFLYFNNNNEFKIGKEKVFWGVTELKNLVDIINSSDGAYGDEKAKLGQSLISYSYINNKIGFVDFIYMPEFHKSTQVGKRGRLRLNLPTETHNTIYEGGAGDRKPSWAVKWQNSIGGSDISFQYFRGNSRETSTLPIIENGQLKYFSGYERITNLGSFFQKVYGPIIYKFEGIKRNGQKNSLFKRENYYSYITGVEYVETRILDKIWDLSFFIEYSNDERGKLSTDIFQNDIFFGTRINFNDIEGTELTQAITIDLDGNGNTGNLEISTRLQESLRFSAEYNFYWSMKPSDTLYSFRRDNYFGISITNYF